MMELKRKRKEKATIRKSSCNLSLSTLTFFVRCNPMDARESLEMMRMWTLRLLVEATSGNCGWRSSSRSFVMLKHTTSYISFFFPQLVILLFLFSNLLNLAPAPVVCRSSPWGFASKGDTKQLFRNRLSSPTTVKDKTFSLSKFRCFSRFFFDSFWFRLPTNQERWIFLS